MQILNSSPMVFGLLPLCCENRIALLRDTRKTYKLSEPLYESILASNSLPNEVSEKVDTEINRLRQMGFWQSTPHSFHLSDRQFSLSLHLAHGCNLACNYCNVQQGTYGDPTLYMSRDVAFKALGYLETVLNGRTARLTFYGGEPLLNWTVLTAVVERAERLFPKLEMEIITNATLLTESRARFLAEHGIFSIISLDGPRPIQDRNRPTTSGDGSYAKAVEGLRNLQRTGGAFHIRATWVPGTCTYDEAFEHLSELAGDSRHVTIALAFQKSREKCTLEYVEALQSQYNKARRGECAQPSIAYPFIDQVLKGDLAPVPECEAGRSGFSVTPDGTLYPCQVSASMKYAKLGTVDGGIDREGQENLEGFLNRPSPACGECWVRPYCSGPCAFSAPLMEAEPYCDVIKLQVREALAAVARATHRDLMGPYEARGISGEGGKHLARGAALRAILWRENRHIKPLFLFPQGAQET